MTGVHSHHHHHHHHGGHHHSHGVPKSHAGQAIRLALFLNLTFACVELAGGWYANSIAVIADAIHDFGDSLALGCALILEIMAARGATPRFTYGMRRLSLVSAAISGLFLLGATIIVVVESIPRLTDPVLPKTNFMIAAAVIGICVNGYAALRLKRGATMNEKVLSWHLIEDVFGWVLILVGGFIIDLTGFAILDPILSIMFSGFILWGVWGRFRETMAIFLQSVPTEHPPAGLEEAILVLPEVISVHDLHVWSLDGEHHVLTAHVVVNAGTTLQGAEELKARIREKLKKIGKFHATIEVESDSVECLSRDCTTPASAKNSLNAL